ncbi:MAG: hypothetical protein A3D26_02895 [Candidatus Blackburnbacteria bacterium RIFCSPHIGHO2_02_FULL_44_20]|uniref:Uncharacterized protein n=1 Tax=Candidatus Blackburnbacteria bacterium RIFCSPHIGHO2_02_FULL_44_20 TaxID=1797516 RepID=A0A1G1V5W3_9BACT|nr:MAG: hypothetical protein A3D26_02895 [Candidatus Blackburnbacteria bacterium RIFCSPHIGHO2_02_FULL_44_20]OGY11882.1 MAG: hypothetical protein A3E16_03775 [Candidatus Blackburnbacteria bacterium RIFCSPHIGHO2_12_FULL_44_25]
MFLTRIPRVSHWFTLALLAAAVAIAICISDNASAQSAAAPRIIVDVTRRIAVLTRAGGHGYHTQSGIVQRGDIVEDHIYVRNMEPERVAEIWLRGSLPFSNLEKISWQGVGANSQSWEVQLYMLENHYLLRYAPDGGIEPGGVGEYIFQYEVGTAPPSIGTNAVLSHNVIQITSGSDQRPVGDDYTSAIWLPG